MFLSGLRNITCGSGKMVLKGRVFHSINRFFFFSFFFCSNKFLTCRGRERCVRRRHWSTKSHERVLSAVCLCFCPHSLSFVPLPFSCVCCLLRFGLSVFLIQKALCVFAPLLSRSRWFVIWLCGHPVCNAWVAFLCMTASFCETSFHLPRVAVLNLCPASVCSMCFVSYFLKLCMSAFTFGDVVCLCIELSCLPSGPTTFFLGMAVASSTREAQRPRPSQPSQKTNAP